MINSISLFSPQKAVNFGQFIPSVKPEDYDSLQDFKRIRNLPGLTCASCGTEMNSEKDIQNYRYFIANAADKPLADALTAALPYMNSTAQSVAKKVISLTSQNESADIKDILTIMARSRKMPFCERQNKKMAAKLKKYMRPEILYSLPRGVPEFLQLTYDMSTKKKLDPTRTRDNKGVAFVRDNVLQKLQYAIAEHPKYAGILSAIRADVQKLDSFYDSADAFVLRCEKLKNAEIADLFFDAKKPTVEHIVTRADGGKNNPGNLLVFCKECNVGRDRTDYREMPYVNPNFVPSLRRFFANVQGHIDNGELPGLENYPKEVAATLNKVSDGNIDIEV